MQLPEKIAITLATYNPNLEYLEKQIQSIKEQDFNNWICHIFDDCSQLEYQLSIRSIIADDPRFICHFYDQNLNHYYNFERGLKYCHKDKTITAIALADQDDIWYPQKLSLLIEQLRSQQAILVHSDLEMIDHNDRTINHSTWDFEGRNPEQLSIDLLLLRNVVTGCSLLFCSSILPDILPFPPQAEINWYHDWWIALVSAQKGKIIHLHQPLVKYRIHTNNSVGVTKNIGKFDRELFAWIGKKFKVMGNSYITHRDLSQLFYNRFQLELDSTNWSNPFDDRNIDFGVKIFKLLYLNLLSRYNSEGIAVKIWVLKFLFDIQKASKIFDK